MQTWCSDFDTVCSDCEESPGNKDYKGRCTACIPGSKGSKLEAWIQAMTSDEGHNSLLVSFEPHMRIAKSEKPKIVKMLHRA